MADNPTNALTNNEVVKQGDNEYRRTVQHLPAFYRTDIWVSVPDKFSGRRDFYQWGHR